jgi:hypothetical protein
MYVLITLLLLLLAIATIIVLRLSRPSPSYAWLAAALGGLFAWISILVWQLDLPHHFSPSLWAPDSLFTSSPEFLADPYAWLYALCLAALAAAVVLTSPAHTTAAINPTAWAGALALTVLGLLAVLADNPLTLVLVWTAIDLTEFFNTLRSSDSPSLSERAVVSFSIRAIGTGFALWASVTNAAGGHAFLFESASSQTGLFLLLAAGLRLGVLPLHLTYSSEPILRRGFGTILRLTAAATSLILLAHLHFTATITVYVPFLLSLVAVAALYSGWMWFRAPDELSGRPYWIIGMSALSLAATLRGSSAGSAAWGSAMLLFGGISFLYSARQVWFTRIFAGLGILLLGLPFSLMATAWEGTFQWPFLFWPLFLVAHLMLVGGYIRHLFHPGENLFSDLPTWAQTAYPAGLCLLVLTIIIVSLWGWPGAIQLGNWMISLILLVLASLIGFALLRYRRLFSSELSITPSSRFSRLGAFQEFLAELFWMFYRTLGRLVGYVASLLEGDGGLLWTLLLLVLFMTILRGQ